MATMIVAKPLSPVRLRCEYAENPLGVDVQQPRFSWVLVHQNRNQGQSAYRLMVWSGSSCSSLTQAWDTGKISFNKSTNIPYTGPALKSDTVHRWAVQYWDLSGLVSSWSENATFTIGLYVQSDWKKAIWITSKEDNVNTLFRKSFYLPTDVARATVYVVGLGYYKLYVNGEKTSQHELGAFTTYTKRVYYDTWNVTSNMQQGHNVLGVSLGPGWYVQLKLGKSVLFLRLSVVLTNGTKMDFISDTTWLTHQGPITLADIYNGETYEAEMDLPGWHNFPFDDSAWSAAIVGSPPSTDVLITSHAILPVIRIGQSFSSCDFWESAPQVYVFDFCQNMAGFTTLHVPEGHDTVPGTNITQLHAEAIHGPPPASIYHHYGNTKEITQYITNGKGNSITYTPQFTYMGFRYVQLTGFPGVPDETTLTAHFIHTDYEMTGDIVFSDPNLNGVQHITRTAAMSNFMSIPTDCPQRERRGWLGDAQLSAVTNLYNFGMAAPYTSFVQQINDAQDPKTGCTQDCVPYYGHGHQPADPAWGAAYTFLADIVATYYDDDRIFQNHYDGIRAHIEQLRQTAASDNLDGLLAFSWWGDWCPPAGCHADKNHKNSAIVSSFMYIKQLRIIARYAAILGKAKDAAMYSELASNVSMQFNHHFYNAKTKTYREPNRTASEYLSPQTTISLAAALDLIPSADLEEVIANLVDDVMNVNKGHLNCGIVGIKELLPTLSDAGHIDVALQISQTPDEPGWVYMWLQGATTLWETWTGTRYQPRASWNHIMFGSQSAWYYQALLGIDLEPNTRGWQNIRFSPKVYTMDGKSICSNLSSVDGSIMTPRGLIRANWFCEDVKCQMVQEHQTAHLTCSSGTISKIIFASFGTPTGACGRFKKNPTCDAPSSVDIIKGLCVGNKSCDIHAEDATFGPDPCFDTKKNLFIQYECTQGEYFSYKVTVPVGSVASVYIPTGDHKPSTVTITESGTKIWDTKYVPGVPGVRNATSSGNAVHVTIGSGQFSFTASTNHGTVV